VPDTCRSAHIVFDADARSVRVARRWFVGEISGADVVDVDLDGAALAVSELVTNAALHGGGPITLVLHVGRGVVRVDVSDAGRGSVEVRRDHGAIVGGHGLRIVEALASRWGFDERDDARTVWVEFLDRRP
jgi:anti-sigma regulatory factor (Ser/Thr protein kinase)